MSFGLGFFDKQAIAAYRLLAGQYFSLLRNINKALKQSGSMYSLPAAKLAAQVQEAKQLIIKQGQLPSFLGSVDPEAVFAPSGSIDPFLLAAVAVVHHYVPETLTALKGTEDNGANGADCLSYDSTCVASIHIRDLVTKTIINTVIQFLGAIHGTPQPENPFAPTLPQTQLPIGMTSTGNLPGQAITPGSVTIQPLPVQPVTPVVIASAPVAPVVGNPAYGVGTRMNGLGCGPCAAMLMLAGLADSLQESELTEMWNLAKDLDNRINALPDGATKTSFVSTLGGVKANLLQIVSQRDYQASPGLFASEYKQNMSVLKYLDQQLAMRTAEPTVVPDTPVQPQQTVAPFTPSGGSVPLQPPAYIYQSPSTPEPLSNDQGGIPKTFLIALSLGGLVYFGYHFWRRAK